MPHYRIKLKKNDFRDLETMSDDKIRVVEAPNQAQALKFVVNDSLDIQLAEPRDFMDLQKQGGAIEVAK